MSKNKIVTTWLWLMSMLPVAVLAAAITLGSGDLLKITVYGNPELNLETRVSEAGKISYPLIGEVVVEGLSALEAEKAIAELLEKGGFVKRPRVNIQVTAMESRRISVLGFVNHPGRYALEGRRSVIDSLALAGGVHPDGADKAILIRTIDGRPTRQEINIPRMMASADLQQNAELMAGDVIYVERAPRFYIYGEVQKPGVFRLDPDTTVVQALAIGGGLSPKGTERRMKLKRRGTDGKIDIMPAKLDNIVQPDDVLYIEESLF